MISFFTHHKSGSSALVSFLGQLSDGSGQPLFLSHLGSTRPPTGDGICCLSNAQYDVVRGHVPGFALHLVRNPLNIVQSAYYSHRHTHGLDGWPQLAAQREMLKSVDKPHGMLMTATFCNSEEFYPETAGPLYAIRNWNYDDPAIKTLRIEDGFDKFTDFLRAALGEASGSLKWPDQANFTFEKLSVGRRAGEIDDGSHYRSGDVDAWKTELPAEVVRYVVGECREVLERFYPESLKWAQDHF